MALKKGELVQPSLNGNGSYREGRSGGEKRPVTGNCCSFDERRQILESLPQKGSFLFIDTIHELSSEHIVAGYKFRGDEWFYSGHFPGNPVTPGVILVEAMAQAGLVALGLYLLSIEDSGAALQTLFTECSVEFLSVVKPGQEVIVRGDRVYWRRRKLRSKVQLSLADGTLAAVGTVSGLGVR
ncbi:MAG: beta-hydroxyacyl-ACP dehydratase [Deltaproteobacteria bacterium]|nr:beta-hydroxyacyl-ACP dehydratase [Deltaproteobacteria bacterium]